MNEKLIWNSSKQTLKQLQFVMEKKMQIFFEIASCWKQEGQVRCHLSIF